MAFFTAASKADFQHQLQAALAQHVSEQDLPQVALFAEQFFGIIALEELTQRRLSDLVGCTLSAWRLLAQFDPSQPQVRVFNPDYEKHGWQSTHTGIEVLHPDIPFLVDSVRIELKRRGYSIHTLQNSVLSVRRDAQGALLELLPKGSTGEGVSLESLMFLEINRCASNAEIKSLQKTLLEVLEEVRLSVADFQPMKAKAQELLGKLGDGSFGHGAIDPAEVEEIKVFLSWLQDNHFTFLGYEEFTVHDAADGGHLQYDESSLLGLSKRLRSGLSQDELHIEPYALAYLREPTLLSFAKAAQPSRVHRPAYPDFVSIREIDASGKVVKECRFLGIYTSTAYSESVREIPYIRRKVAEVEKRSGFISQGHLSKELVKVLEVLPRDDLFQTPVDELASTALSIVQIQERNKVRLFLRFDPYGRFVYALAYVPRDIYSTETRLRIQQVLVDRLQASDCEFWTYFSESVLARVQFILRVDPKNKLDIDPQQLEREVVQACRSWTDDYAALAVENFGEAKGTRVLTDFPKSFPAGYRERFAPHSAVVDMQHLRSLSEDRPLVMSFYQPLVPGERQLHCKLYHADTPLALSDVLPVLENLGLRVLGEFPYRLQHQSGREFWIHDFAFTYAEGVNLDIQQLNDTLQDAFVHIVRGDAENDSFNRLVLTAGLAWRDVALLRAYARYLKQIRLGFDLGYIANTLLNHADIARELVRLFRTRFYLARKLSANDLNDKQQKLEQAILGALDNVAVLNEDRILRRYLDLIKATLRTNFYQPDALGEVKSYFSFKFNPSAIPELPRPVPKFEIFVYSPRVEGVHLRFGNVARGGLRWSDREEDFRTEVLGLVKAQQVKNAVIVPVGAKGGFVPRRLPLGGSRDEIQAEAIACYRIFISGLLDITDNLKEGEVAPPANVVRHDGDDPYLVVAADKGTATFSDIANGLAIAHGFWMGDAFASGGSVGYDHKGMGITARGAWESVKRHFRALGRDSQTQDFTAVGVGDMSGDVFGNGMLLSRHIRLVAAFDHRHIFLDPNPDAATTFVERERLFTVPRSSWADYDAKLISKGGGIYPRSLKSIEITPQVREALGLDDSVKALSPNDLMSAILKAPVDLLWNGGIGTYVKAASEQHSDVGDRANNALRVNGGELRCKVVGEGGNLGMTQLGRIEAAQAGVLLNTDFIDNSAGVDTSDHEVNIKILLNDVVRAKKLTVEQRNKLLASMTDEVADLVLNDNYRQNQALSLMERMAVKRLGSKQHFIRTLEQQGLLDRQIEFLPSDAELSQRKARGQGLTRPELSVLLSYSKLVAFAQLLDSDIPEDPYLSKELQRYFPTPLQKKYADAMERHRLKREIIATAVTNQTINRMGATFLMRMQEDTGRSIAEVAKAYTISRETLDARALWAQIDALDGKVPESVQIDALEVIWKLQRSFVRWLLSRPGAMPGITEAVNRYQGPFNDIRVASGVLPDSQRPTYEALVAEWKEKGLPSALAQQLAELHFLEPAFDIIELARTRKLKPVDVSKVHFRLGDALQLPWLFEQVDALEVNGRWHAVARGVLRDELAANHRNLAGQVLGTKGSSAEAKVAAWMGRDDNSLRFTLAMLAELAEQKTLDYPTVSVAVQRLGQLAAHGA
ncbi:NAD-glutamate dehydrogenase [uncultured Stenotrophomonas sp.]|uniref:NAD-glutamate dehydrogenase n=1 Tax=uncultured Stenotrophomonas sp. TaxID=165438 RepID=UPI0025E1C418|nr:NAD-glutamate dehydrogenase [uncultured Stenotrophomonas sp.]